MSELRLVQGSDVPETLRDEGEVAVYTYRVNTPIFILTAVVSGAILTLAGVMWWNSQLAGAGWIAGFSVLVSMGVGLGILALYWYSYTQTHFVAFSDEKVFVGGRDKMWCIGWSLLDRESLGFEEMSVGSTGGSLDLQVGGEEIPLRLYNTFVHLEDIQGFMFRILKHLKGEDIEVADIEEAAGEGDLADALGEEGDELSEEP